MKSVTKTNEKALVRTQIELVRNLLDTYRLDALIISRVTHIRYLTNFTGSSALLLISPRKLHFITDSRYAVQAAEEVDGWKITIARKGLMEEVKQKGLLRSARRVGFESNYIFHTQYRNYRKLVPGKRWIPLAETIEPYMKVKNDIEIEMIEQSISIAEKAFNEVLPLIRPGISERDVAAELLYRMQLNGAEKNAFDIIVASGARTALPHGVASDKKINNNELLLIDFGCIVNGYHSDITRTVSVGRAGGEEKKVFGIVRQALENAVDSATSGLTCNQVDAAARTYIDESGYGGFFGHSLGHGIGLEIHELPRISPFSTEVLEIGNVVTIEPGIYIPGSFGIRIEDDVLIRSDGCRVLTQLPKELIEL